MPLVVSVTASTRSRWPSSWRELSARDLCQRDHSSQNLAILPELGPLIITFRTGGAAVPLEESAPHETVALDEAQHDVRHSLSDVDDYEDRPMATTSRP